MFLNQTHEGGIKSFFLSELRATLPSLSHMTSFRMKNENYFEFQMHLLFGNDGRGPAPSQVKEASVLSTHNFFIKAKLDNFDND